MSRQTLYRNLTNTLYIYQNKTYLVSCLASGCPLKRVPHLWCLVSMGSSCSSRNSPKAPILSDTSHITSSYHSSLFVQKAIRSQGSRFGLYSVMLRYQYFWLSRAWKTLCGGKWQAIGVAAAGCTFAVHFQLLSSSGPGILKNVLTWHRQPRGAGKNGTIAICAQNTTARGSVNLNMWIHLGAVVSCV